MNWYLNALKKYAVFSGRARRKEYWYFQLFNTLILAALFLFEIMTGTLRWGPGFGLLSATFALATFLPAFAVLVRRLHDTNRSGWWFLASLIPLAGPIIMLVFTFQDSQPGENQYGPNPKGDFVGPMSSGTALQAG